MTRLINDDEIGKAFSAIAIFAAIMPFVSNPAYRLLYDYTLEDRPEAFFLLSGCVLILAFVINVTMAYNRHHMGGEKTMDNKSNSESAEKCQNGEAETSL